MFWVNNLLSIHTIWSFILELNTDWPDSVDASAHLKEKSIVKSLEGKRNAGSKIKRTILGLCLTFMQTEPVCSVACGIGQTRQPDYQEMEGQTGQNSATLLVSAHTFAYIFKHMPCLCLFYAFLKCIWACTATRASGSRCSHMYGAI